jgi:hypothetical protein
MPSNIGYTRIMLADDKSLDIRYYIHAGAWVIDCSPFTEADTKAMTSPTTGKSDSNVTERYFAAGIRKHVSIMGDVQKAFSVFDV